MVFICRICGSKFMRSVSYEDQLDNDIQVSSCGHLFHKKCLDVSFTHQKLSHATSGTGPFRRHCPAYQCSREIPENGIIDISSTQPKSPTGEEIVEGNNDTEAKLTKRAQMLVAEKEKLQQQLNKLENENEGYREVIDEIKAECVEIAAFLLDDKMMKKGDRVFWITKERTLAPGRILEMRRKSNSSNNNNANENSPFAIIKLDKKIILPSLNTERETAIVPVSEVITFKSFFKDSYLEFRHKLWKILDESKEKFTEDGRQRLLRSKFRESSLRLSMDTGIERPSLSSSHEAIDSIPLENLSNGDVVQNKSLKRGARIFRAKSMYFGMQRAKTISEDMTEENKHRSTSWTNSKSASPAALSKKSASFYDYSNISSANQSPTLFSSSSPGPPTIGYDKDDDNHYITAGERVIYYDQTSQFPQTGEVECVLKYTPCAIVKFDDLPDGINNAQQQGILKYRTVPLIQLFPYALSSAEEKFKIAESYGKMYEFVQEHCEMFEGFDEDSESLDDDDEEEESDDPKVESEHQKIQENDHEDEYFSTSSVEDELYIATIHEV